VGIVVDPVSSSRCLRKPSASQIPGRTVVAVDDDVLVEDAVVVVLVDVLVEALVEVTVDVALVVGVVIGGGELAGMFWVRPTACGKSRNDPVTSF